MWRQVSCFTGVEPCRSTAWSKHLVIRTLCFGMEGRRSETSAAEANEEVIYTSVKFSQTPPPRAKAGRERRGKEAGWGRSTKDFFWAKARSNKNTLGSPLTLSTSSWCCCLGSKILWLCYCDKSQWVRDPALFPCPVRPLLVFTPGHSTQAAFSLKEVCSFKVVCLSAIRDCQQ